MLVTDKKGRTIVVESMTPGVMLDLIDALGDTSSNIGYVRHAVVICSVREIGGTPVPFPTNKKEVRAMAETLGSDGFVAVTKALTEMMEAEDEGASVKN